ILCAIIMKPFRHTDYKGIFMSRVFRHYSQYKYITLIPKQPAHILPKSGHDSASIFNTVIH
ncbi:hypothetical protein P4520_28700, partial [Bacillus thuringiensis]